MKYRINKRDSLRFGLSLFLILGAVSGTLFCNMMDADMQLELISTESSMVSASVLQNADFAEVFLRVLSGRLSQLFVCFLFAMTPAAPFLFLAVCAYFGFSSAVLICAFTMEAGAFGILRYLVVITPQFVFYTPVLYALIWWFPQSGRRLGVPAAAALTVTVVLGAAAESWFNPWLAAMLL